MMSARRRLSHWLLPLLLACCLVTSWLLEPAHGFIFWKAKTTACDTCDGIDTYSGRNVMCCFLSSKCCGYNSLDEAEAIRANVSAQAAAAG